VLKKEEVESLAKRIMQDISKPYHIKAQEIHITSSLGISIFPTDSDQSDYLTVQADAAMYGAKNQARNTYQFYNPELHANALERLDLENDLRHALEHGELQVYYQPLYNLLSKQIIGMEALLRWNHPKLGMISPSKFITAAEESGIIVPLGEWVLRESCLQLRRWQQEGLTHSIYVSVNVSIQQLDEDFIQTVESILAEVGLEAKYLELEITESSVLPDDKIVITLLEKLHQMGIGLCIDDFGTGYSALSRIGKLPISTLKIDRSFITPITEERSNFSIVRAIVNIAHTLRLKVIAEGVESDIQAEFLESLGCDCIQGYLISPPVPASEFKRLIE
jgi:EAL domain-containing protein (putative c-di-GMP-specific phosphodiesterase class I)